MNQLVRFNRFAEIPCTQLSGVTKNISEKLARCNVLTVQDLLFHKPLRYEDRTQCTPITNLIVDTYALVQGTIIETRFYQRGFLVYIQDNQATLTIRFFHGTRTQFERLKYGWVLRCFGQLRLNQKHVLQMTHPDYECFPPHCIKPLPAYLTPIYPTTEGLTQKQWRYLIAQACDYYLPQLPDYLNGMLDATWPDLKTALKNIHRPIPQSALAFHSSLKINQRRVALEELLAQNLSIRKTRLMYTQYQATAFKSKGTLAQQVLASLKIQLTRAQQRTLDEITYDLKQTRPMLRLLQGDVGSGKTLVALFAALPVIENRAQVVLMAPTELLAKQHYQNFQRWLASWDISMVCVTADSKNKKTLLDQIAQGQIQIVLGTHALIQEAIRFKQLGLILIDEQHRFGVIQRSLLMKKGQQNDCPHQLFMTATPIPRTLAMSFCALDCSIIDEYPPGRKPIQTLILSNRRRSEIIRRIEVLIARGHQVYWVCPLITDSIKHQHYQAAKSTEQYLKTQLPQLRIGLIHGQLSATKKDQIMSCFKQGAIDILVATSVIEVGVDVANACLIIIENAERLGLAQLHQLRGRVGRSTLTSYCILLYETLTPLARTRLEAMRTIQDGFVLAQRDLELRGWGDLLGDRQSGILGLKFADLGRDADLMTLIQTLSDKITQHTDLMDGIVQRWLVYDKQCAETA